MIVQELNPYSLCRFPIKENALNHERNKHTHIPKISYGIHQSFSSFTLAQTFMTDLSRPPVHIATIRQDFDCYAINKCLSFNDKIILNQTKRILQLHKLPFVRMCT
jgi:hypothetical protein